ncbi:hypothetical protein SRHO_G00079610, partial [Serrasalmus rhombeus]
GRQSGRWRVAGAALLFVQVWRTPRYYWSHFSSALRLSKLRQKMLVNITCTAAVSIGTDLYFAPPPPWAWLLRLIPKHPQVFLSNLPL